MATAPVAMVLINIPMATLRVLNQVTIPFYMCVISMAVYGLWNIFNKSHFMPTEDEFKVHSKMLFWVLTIVVNGPCYNLAWQFKVLAYKCDKVTRVAPVFYLETALSMILDILLFHIQYSVLQFSGLILVLGMFAVIIVLAYCTEYNTDDKQKNSNSKIVTD